MANNDQWYKADQGKPRLTLSPLRILTTNARVREYAMVLHDKFGFGPVRCERFTDAVLDLYESFDKGYVTLEDIHGALKEETGITIERTVNPHG